MSGDGHGHGRSHSHGRRLEHLPSTDSAAALLESPSTEDAEVKPLSTGCGVGSCHPSWMQSCANIRIFTVMMCILACVNGSISASYLPSVITTIERRYEFGSSVTGLVVASYEVGAIIAVIFVSYLGTKRHIPKVIGIGTVLVGTGTCLFALPHFISPPYSLLVNVEENRTSHDTCLIDVLSPSAPKKDFCDIDGIRSGTELYVIIFIVAQSLIGVGSTPILTLGLSYIDNHVTKKKSPQYLGKSSYMLSLII